MGQEITIIIDDATGDMTISVDGVQGPSCVDLTKELEEELGVVTGRVLKDEHNARVRRTVDRTVHQRRG